VCLLGIKGRTHRLAPTIREIVGSVKLENLQKNLVSAFMFCGSPRQYGFQVILVGLEDRFHPVMLAYQGDDLSLYAHASGVNVPVIAQNLHDQRLAGRTLSGDPLGDT